MGVKSYESHGLQLFQKAAIEKATVTTGPNILSPLGEHLEAFPQEALSPLSAISVTGPKPAPEKVPRLASEAKQGMEALPAPFLGVVAHLERQIELMRSLKRDVPFTEAINWVLLQGLFWNAKSKGISDKELGDQCAQWVEGLERISLDAFLDSIPVTREGEHPSR